MSVECCSDLQIDLLLFRRLYFTISLLCFHLLGRIECLSCGLLRPMILQCVASRACAVPKRLNGSIFYLCCRLPRPKKIVGLLDRDPDFPHRFDAAIAKLPWLLVVTFSIVQSRLKVINLLAICEQSLTITLYKDALN